MTVDEYNALPFYSEGNGGAGDYKTVTEPENATTGYILHIQENVAPNGSVSYINTLEQVTFTTS